MIKLASSEAKVMSKDTMDTVDILRGKVLSTFIILVYFTSLVVYALHTRPASRTMESYLFMLQFMILSIWTGSLVQWRDATLVIILALSFICLVHQRGGSVPKSPFDAVKVK